MAKPEFAPGVKVTVTEVGLAGETVRTERCAGEAEARKLYDDLTDTPREEGSE